MSRFLLSLALLVGLTGGVQAQTDPQPQQYVKCYPVSEARPFLASIGMLPFLSFQSPDYGQVHVFLRDKGTHILLMQENPREDNEACLKVILGGNSVKHGGAE